VHDHQHKGAARVRYLSKPVILTLKRPLLYARYVGVNSCCFVLCLITVIVEMDRAGRCKC
jgi:hypothetical protein